MVQAEECWHKSGPHEGGDIPSLTSDAQVPGAPDGRHPGPDW